MAEEHTGTTSETPFSHSSQPVHLSPLKAHVDANGAPEMDEAVDRVNEDHEIDAIDDQAEGRDYAKIFEKYQERFNQAYAISKKLFQTEKAQRQTLNYYYRRNNTLLDLLDKFETEQEQEESFDIDPARVANIIELNPQLGQSLTPLLNLSDSQVVKKSYKVNLVVAENVPELVNDDLDVIEQNPQDTEPWVRRNYSHLVVSKFKAIDVMTKGVRENADAALGSKKRKKLPKDEGADAKKAKK